jgi:hypothetical protein
METRGAIVAAPPVVVTNEVLPTSG